MTTVVNNDVPAHLLRDALRRRWWIVGLCVIVAVGLVLGMSSARTPTYTATSTVLLRPLAGNSFDVNSSTSSTQVTIAMETEAQLVASPDVAAMASSQLGGHIVGGTTQVSALVPTNTETVQITFTASSPVAAREGADAFAGSFLRFRTDRATHSNSVQLQQITKQSQDAQRSLSTAMQAAKVAHTPNTDAQVQLFASRVSSLEESASQLKATGTNPGFVVSPAAAPTAPNGISSWMYLAAAVLLGLLFGVAIAVWREHSTDVVRAETEDSAADVPILTLLPAQRRDAPALLSEPGADEAVKNAYRQARIGLLARITNGSVIAVSDLSGTDRAGEISANLALSLAEAGHRVTVVDAALEDQQVTRLVGEKGSKGLSDALASSSESALPLTEAGGMRVLGAGTASAAQMRDLYAGRKLQSVLNELRKEADVVLVAAGPATSAEGSAVAFGTDGVILVLANGRTTHENVRDTISRDAWLGVPVIGLICDSRRLRTPRRGRRATGPQHASGTTSQVRQSTDEATEEAADHDTTSAAARDSVPVNR